MALVTDRVSQADPWRLLRSCWTCPHSGEHHDRCDRLTLDEQVDAPIIDWLEAVGMREDGTVPTGADGCPGWG